MQEVAADRGTDLESLFQQHQSAKALAEQYGIKLAFEPYGTTHQLVMTEEVDEDGNQKN